MRPKPPSARTGPVPIRERNSARWSASPPELSSRRLPNDWPTMYAPPRAKAACPLEAAR